MQNATCRMQKILSVVLFAFCILHSALPAQAPLPTPGFHHLHLSSVNPEAAIDFYTKAFPSTSKLPALDWDGMDRAPSVTNTLFGDVSLFWYMNQGDTPAVSTRGHVMDHIALSIADLDAWIAKLRAEQVTILEQLYIVGGSRAVMIEGPSNEAIELIEVK